MTAVIRSNVPIDRLITVLVTAALSVAITMAVMLNVGATSATADHSDRANPTLCRTLAHATLGSPASFRLTDEISAQGRC
jgi:hypothetical protein